MNGKRVSELKSLDIKESVEQLKRTDEDHRHSKTLIKVGEYEVFVGGSGYIKQGDLEDVDIVIPFGFNPLPMLFGKKYVVLCGYWECDHEVKESWPEFIQNVLEELKIGKKIFAYCRAGHGRAGTFLSSLIALLETKEKSPDPIFEARKRYCPKAVETKTQAEMIFDLRGGELPERYGKRGALLKPDDRFEE